MGNWLLRIVGTCIALERRTAQRDAGNRWLVRQAIRHAIFGD